MATLDYAVGTDSNIVFSSDVVFAGQTFNTRPASLTSVKFYLKQVGTASGNMYAALFDHTGTFGTTGEPTGTALAISDTINAATIVATDYVEVEFTFSAYDLEWSQYAIGVHYNSWIDGDDGIYMGRGLAEGHPGVAFTFTTAGDYTTDSTNDAGFAAIGTLALTDVPRGGGITIQAKPKSVREILNASQSAMKSQKQVMKNKMMERARIARAEAIRNQKKIKSLKK